MMHDDEERAEWIEVASYASGFEADMARQVLEAEEIPVLVQSNSPGIFGAAFQGKVAGGFVLHVPSPLVDEARTLLQQEEWSREDPDLFA